MLTPEYLLTCTDDVIDMYRELDQAITNDICRRIAKTGMVTDTAKWQIQIAQESGAVLNDIVTQVAECTNRSQAEIWKMFKDAGIACMKFDAELVSGTGVKASLTLSPTMEQILAANANRTYTTLNNLMYTSAAQSQTLYYQVMNEAVMKVESGAFSYAEALRYAVDKCASEGAWVQYRSGARMHLEAAARMNLLTAIGQTAAKLTEMNAKDMGAEYYETSAHFGARPSHQEWQGQVFKIDGADEYPNFYDETGYGEGDGLCGWNCRHSFYPFFPGLSLPAYDKNMLDDYAAEKYPYNGKEYTDYQANQKMRKMERDIRDAKRKVAAYKEALDACRDDDTRSELERGYADAKALLRKRRAKLTDFCRQTGMEKDYLRVRIPGQSRTTSAQKP